MRDNQDQMLLALFKKMTDKDRKWLISVASDAVRESALAQDRLRMTHLKMVVGGRRAS